MAQAISFGQITIRLIRRFFSVKVEVEMGSISFSGFQSAT